MRIHFDLSALLACLLVAACDDPAEGSATPTPPTVADLTDAVALVQLDDDPVLYRQLSDDTLAAVLDEEARLASFVTTDTHAYVQLAEPFWLQGEADGQWCVLLDLSLTDGDTVAPGCLSRTVETDPGVALSVDELPVEVHAYDDTEVWVFWRVTHAENDVDDELWVYRDGVGVHATTVEVMETAFAVEGGFVHGRELWTVDGGAAASTTLDEEPFRARWGPYQFTGDSYRLFRPSEGFVDLPDVMGGDPYCAQHLSESSSHTFSDGPNLLVHIGTQWDDDPDVPLTYCRCDLAWDCQLVTEAEETELQTLPHWNDVVDPATTDGLAYLAWYEEAYVVHDLQVSRDLGAEYETDRFFQWGHDLYFVEEIASVPDRLFRVDWVGDDAAVTELTAFPEVDVVRLVRL